MLAGILLTKVTSYIILWFSKRRLTSCPPLCLIIEVSGFLTKAMEKRDMMINKRLINTISESKKYIAANVALQWLSPAANIVMMTAVT